MNRHTEGPETQTPSAKNSQRAGNDVQALWQSYSSKQRRGVKLARPFVIGLGIALLFLLGVTLWIVAVL
jgi:hypothetical protein